MTETIAWTIKRLLDWTSEHFTSHGSDSGRLDAEILLAAALGCQRIELYTRFDQVPPDKELACYREWVKQRAKGEPVAYLVGYKEFYSLKFKVNSNVLIPRPETEHVVLKAIEAAEKIKHNPLRIADVGTGSGCIAIALAKHIPNSNVVACDISADALNVASENVAAHQLKEQVQLLESDLLAAIDGEFHLIVSNPPYIGTLEENTVDNSVRNFEPSVALFAGEKGSEVIERLVEQSATKLVPGGFLIFETSPIIMDHCVQLVSAHQNFSDVVVVKDYTGLKRVVVAERG